MPANEMIDRNGKVLSAGDIFTWDDFPYQNDEVIKLRYFVFLGRTSIMATPFLFYMRTTTTKAKPGLICVEFYKSEIPCFAEDCRISFDFRMDSYPSDTMDMYSGNIECIGKLPVNKANELINKIDRNDRYTAPIVVREIKECFRKSGYSIK